MIRMCYLPSLYAQQPYVYLLISLCTSQSHGKSPQARKSPGGIFLCQCYMLCLVLCYMLCLTFGYTYVCQCYSYHPQSNPTYTVQMPELSVFFVIILSSYILYTYRHKTDKRRTRYGRFCPSITPLSLTRKHADKIIHIVTYPDPSNKV